MGKLLFLLLLLLIVPFFCGYLLKKVMRTKDRRPGTVILYGYLVMFSVFFVTALPVILIDYKKFDLLVVIYSAELVVLTSFGIYVFARATQQFVKKKQSFSFSKFMKKYDLTAKIIWVLFGATLLFQMYKVHVMTSFDGDDAFYVSVANLANQTGEMYYFNPYTGKAMGIDLSHAIAPFPIWIAYLSRVFKIHASVVAHEILPMVMLPLTYYVYFLIGERLFYKRKECIPVFMLFISLMQIFGNVSIYTRETFFLTRTWQGKAMYSNLIMLLQFYIVLSLSVRQHQEWKKAKQQNEQQNNVYTLKIVFESKRDLWILLPLINISACLMTALSAAISCIFFGITGLVIAVYHRNFKDFIKLMLCCIPYLITAMIHFL